MSKLVDELFAKMGNPKNVEKFKPQLIELENTWRKRIKHIPEFENENQNLIISNELFEALRDYLAGNDGRFSRKVYCKGHDGFVSVPRLWTSTREKSGEKLVPFHNCRGFDLTAIDLNSQQPKEIALPTSEEIADAKKEMLFAEKAALERENSIRARIKARYLDVEADKAMGLQGRNRDD